LSRNYAFVTKYKELTLKIGVCPLDALKPHELVIESLLISLIKRIIESKVVYDPLIVDENSLVVLDGMHRLEALKRMKVKFAPVCFVDYNDQSILLKRWFRIVENPPSKDIVMKVLYSRGLRVEKVDFNEANDAVNKREAYFALHWRDYSLIVKGHDQFVDIVKASKELYGVETALRGYGAKISYMTEGDALKSFTSSETNVLITTILLSKDEVVDIALKGELLAPKSTRHIIPIRPLSVNVPLEILTYSIDLQGMLNWLTEFLNKRDIVIVEGGAVVRGRKYEEDILLFK